MMKYLAKIWWLVQWKNEFLHSRMGQKPLKAGTPSMNTSGILVDSGGIKTKVNGKSIEKLGLLVNQKNTESRSHS